MKENKIEKNISKEKNDTIINLKFYYQNMKTSQNIIIISFDIKYKAPTIIEYDNKKFKINNKNYYDKVEATWKYINYRRIKGNSKNQNIFEKPQ